MNGHRPERPRQLVDVLQLSGVEFRQGDVDLERDSMISKVPTSGLMVFGRGAEMQRRLSRLFHDRKVSKRYVALAAGKLVPTSGEIGLPLGADWPNRPLQKVDHEEGKHSLTRYRVLTYDTDADITRVELEPVTGRTHQLRVHLAAIGHPIIGDALYGGIPAARLFLHASSLCFAHPRTGLLLDFISKPPF